MAQRTIRRKIRDQGVKVDQDFVRIIDHLKYLDDLSEGKSEYINSKLPQLILMIEGCRSVTELFLDGL